MSYQIGQDGGQEKGYPIQLDNLEWPPHEGMMEPNANIALQFAQIMVGRHA